ncbi:DUF2157 domain-containing protein [Paraglaciecola sp. L1A13]|uniref:DUF2157 domain-containing protein n=1 Tax=Paraglaciecola sp. L1A13 TaxID=2686359 RepID=UPI00131E8FF5|nr:DUF2157 domain-containing protein [Paraglaciecola sp. L1A13]
MRISDRQLNMAVAEGILTSEQAHRLTAYILVLPEGEAKFDFTHLMYYFGGLVAIGAMTVFMNLGWESFGGIGVLGLCAIYAIAGILLTNRFTRQGLSVVAGICATFVVTLTPLATFGLQHALGVWPGNDNYQDYHRYIQWHWLYMELGTVAVGVILAKVYKYPFLVMPIAVTLWYLSMDLAVMLTGERPEYEVRALVSMYVGLLMLGLAFCVDIRSRHSGDYAFWLYLLGTIAFWGGLTMQESTSELSKFLYCCVNLLMMGIGIVLVRRVLVIFGAFGVCGYIGYLAYDVFSDSWLFPIILTLLGFAIVYLGIIWQKNEQAVTQRLRHSLPLPLQELLDKKTM